MEFFPLAYAVLCIFLAAIVRGFAGFGFSLLAITTLSLVFPLPLVIPAVFMLEIAASIHMLPAIWRDIHWRSLLPLIAGCFVATPIGVWLLATADPRPMQIAVGIFVLVAVALMWKGFALKSMPGTAASVAAGAAAGFANGAFGIGGPPVILFYFASPAGNMVGRASLIAFFLAIDTIGIANLSLQGLMSWEAVKLAALFLPALVAGVWVGARSFTRTDPALFRKVVLVIMAALAVMGMVKAVIQEY
jgi:uncharacterized protein